MMGTLLHCIDCNKIIHMTEWDFCDHYEWQEGEIKELEGNDRKAFEQRHKNHRTEELTLVTPPISDKPYAEPLKTSYFEASNGQRRFLIKRWRSTIDDPCEYEIIDGRLKIVHGKVRVQTEAIKKQFRMEHDVAIAEKKLNCFVMAIQEEVKNLDPDTLEVSAEGETPLISFCQLGSESVKRILKRCQEKFNRHELKLLRDFVIEHNEYDDVMTVVAKKEFSIKREILKDSIPRAARSAQLTSIPNL
jgi:hypothetical protein